MNVIVILSDTFRWDHLGHNGNEWIETPRLDELSRESAIFDNCYTENLPTLPMRTAAFTGRFTFPWRGWEDMRVEDQRLSWLLWQNGIYSALISDSMPMFTMSNLFCPKWDLVHFVRGHAGGLFNEKEARAKVQWDRFFPAGRVCNTPDVNGHLMHRTTWKTEEDHQAPRVIKQAVKWIDGYDASQPFMLWLDIFDPHEPWTPPKEFWRKYDPDYNGELWPVCPDANQEGFSMTAREDQVFRAYYAGKCTMVDKWIGIFLDRLRAKGLMEDTLIVFTSDHGAPLGDGIWGHGLYRKCANWPYEELAHTPLLVRHPQGLAAGKRYSTFVQSCDLTATVLDAFGLKPTEKMHSRSVLPIVRGESETHRDFAVACHSERSEKGSSRSIRNDEWTYMYWPGGKRKTPPLRGRDFPAEELYRRSEDLYEQKNVIAEYPDVARELALKLRWFEDELKKGGE